MKEKVFKLAYINVCMGDSEKDVEKVSVDLYPSEIHSLLTILGYNQVQLSEIDPQYAVACHHIYDSLLREVTAEYFFEALDEETDFADDMIEEFKEEASNMDFMGKDTNFGRGVQ